MHVCSCLCVCAQNQPFAVSSTEWKRECRLIEWEKCLYSNQKHRIVNKDVLFFLMTWHEYIVRSTHSHAHAANLVNSIQRHTTAHSHSPISREICVRIFTFWTFFSPWFNMFFMTLIFVNNHYHVSCARGACNGMLNWIQDKSRWYRC